MTTPVRIPRFLTIEEVSELLRTPVSTLRWWRHLRKGPPSFRLGRRVLYAADDVQAYMDQLRTGDSLRSAA